MAPRRTRRPRRGRANRSRPNKSRGKTRVFATNGPNNQRVTRVPRMRRGGLAMRQRPGLSEGGLAFLKCAFASPDFSVDPGKGIPDQFHGRTLGIKDCYTDAIAFTPNRDTYILQAPVPGFAYFKAEVPIGTEPTQFVGVPFPTYTTNFGTGTDATINYSKFRYASMAFGVYPTSNMMQFSGSIQSWRVDLNLAENLTTQASGAQPVIVDTAVVTKRIQGLQGVVPLAPRDNYSENFIKGAYTFAFDKSQDFEWCDFCSGTTYTQAVQVLTNNPTNTKALVAPGVGPAQLRLTGLGNVNTLVFKVSTPPAAVNTALLRAWNCIELQPDTNSALFQFSGVSPPHDPLALELYHNLKMSFPVAMPCAENAKFWETVLRAIEHGSRMGMMMPGPFGVLSSGINLATGAIQGMMGTPW